MARRHDDYDTEAATDRLLFRENSRITAGANAFHQLDPSEIAMRLEEFEPEHHAHVERAALRNEIFNGFAEYLFADGPAPAEVRARLQGFFESFHPDLAAAMHGPVEWVSGDEVRRVLRKYQKKLAAAAAVSRSRGALSVWYRELEKEIDFECVRETLVELVKFMVTDGKRWRAVTAIAYCVAKALHPSLIGGMSLEDIATLSGDQGGRATPDARCKRIYSRRLADAGAKGCQIHFQKSATATANMAKAQQGNNNRSKNQRRRKSASKKSKP